MILIPRLHHLWLRDADATQRTCRFETTSVLEVPFCRNREQIKPGYERQA